MSMIQKIEIDGKQVPFKVRPFQVLCKRLKLI